MLSNIAILAHCFAVHGMNICGTLRTSRVLAWWRKWEQFSTAAPLISTLRRLSVKTDSSVPSHYCIISRHGVEICSQPQDISHAQSFWTNDVALPTETQKGISFLAMCQQNTTLKMVYGVRFDISTVVIMKRTVVLHITPCNLAEVFWRFGGKYYLHIQIRRVNQGKNPQKARF
jgi:hypothetical protein